MVTAVWYLKNCVRAAINIKQTSNKQTNKNHLLSNEQKGEKGDLVLNTVKLLKSYPKYTKQTFDHLVTDGEIFM
jgi:hypothetical protein